MGLNDSFESFGNMQFPRKKMQFPSQNIQSFRSAVNRANKYAQPPASQVDGAPGNAPQMSALSPGHGLARWVVLLGFSSPILLVQAGGEQFYVSLRYDRAAVLNGEWWRLFTAHLVHLGWAHCLLNLMGLALCVMFASGFRSLRAWAGALTVLPLGIGLLLLLVSPEVADYAGLSGVLYGLFILALAPAARRGDALAWIALVVVSARIGWQMLDASGTAKSALFDGYVVAPGHLYGAISATAMLIWGTLRQNPPHLT